MTAPTVPRADEVTLSVEEVRSAATGLGIATPLRRLTAAGLIAPPRSRGRGRGRGREYCYPARVLDQLATLADARRLSHRYATLRHLIWWQPQGHLEDWSLWQRDCLADIAIQARCWALLAAGDDDGDLSPERERDLLELAEELRSSRLPGLPRMRLRTPANTLTYVRMFTSAIFGNDLLVPTTGDGAEGDWRAVAAEPVDTDEGDAVGGTMGHLFQRGVGWRTPSSDGTGFGALACAANVPPPAQARGILASMTQEDARALRDVVLQLAARNGSADLLREQPLFAAIALVTMVPLALAFRDRFGDPVAA